VETAAGSRPVDLLAVCEIVDVFACFRPHYKANCMQWWIRRSVGNWVRAFRATVWTSSARKERRPGWAPDNADWPLWALSGHWSRAANIDFSIAGLRRPPRN